MTGRGFLTVIAAAALFAATACSGSIRPMPRQSFGVRSGIPFQGLVHATHEQGYEVEVLQPERRRFGVVARHRRGRSADSNYRIAIECEQRTRPPAPAAGAMPARAGLAGYCTMTPYGPRVEWTGTRWLLPARFRAEVVELQEALQAASNAYR